MYKRTNGERRDLLRKCEKSKATGIGKGVRVI